MEVSETGVWERLWAWLSAQLASANEFLAPLARLIETIGGVPVVIVGGVGVRRIARCAVRFPRAR